MASTSRSRLHSAQQVDYVQHARQGGKALLDTRGQAHRESCARSLMIIMATPTSLRCMFALAVLQAATRLLLLMSGSRTSSLGKRYTSFQQDDMSLGILEEETQPLAPVLSNRDRSATNRTSLCFLFPTLWASTCIRSCEQPAAVGLLSHMYLAAVAAATRASCAASLPFLFKTD